MTRIVNDRFDIFLPARSEQRLTWRPVAAHLQAIAPPLPSPVRHHERPITSALEDLGYTFYAANKSMLLKVLAKQRLSLRISALGVPVRLANLFEKKRDFCKWPVFGDRVFR